MSFWDKMKQITRPYSEEEYDDYEEEMDDYAAEPVEQEAPQAARRARRTSPFDTATAEPETRESTASAAASATRTATATHTTESASTGFSGQVISMGSSKQDVVLFHAKNLEDAALAAVELRKKRAIIVNMENVDKALARRVVDFLSGAVYALEGKGRKIAQSTYLFCPNTVNVVGDLENVQKDSTDTYI